jgi:hypothetical protein
MAYRDGITISLPINPFMVYQVAFYALGGLPLVAWGGLVTLVSLATTATLGFLFHTGRANFRFVWHIRAAVITLALAVFHVAIAILALLGF